MPFPKEPTTPHGWRYLSDDEKQLLMAKRQADHARVTGDTPTLLAALIIIGEFDEAIKLGSEEAREIKRAVGRRDTDRCKCVYEIEAHTFDAKGRVKWTGEMVRAKNYLRKYQSVWSKKHDKPVPVYQCYVCGHLQAMDGEIDEFHAKVNEARLEAVAVPDAVIGKVNKGAA